MRLTWCGAGAGAGVSATGGAFWDSAAGGRARHSTATARTAGLSSNFCQSLQQLRKHARPCNREECMRARGRSGRGETVN